MAIGTVLGAGLSGLLGYKGAQMQQKFNAQQAFLNRDFQERMSSTAHQRQVADMRKAGLNPILSATGGGGSSTPGGATASSGLNPLEKGAHSAASLALLKEQVRNARYQGDILSPDAVIGRAKADAVGRLEDPTKTVLDKLEDTVTGASAKEVADSISKAPAAATKSIVQHNTKSKAAAASSIRYYRRKIANTVGKSKTFWQQQLKQLQRNLGLIK